METLQNSVVLAMERVIVRQHQLESTLQKINDKYEDHETIVYPTKFDVICEDNKITSSVDKSLFYDIFKMQRYSIFIFIILSLIEICASGFLLRVATTSFREKSSHFDEMIELDEFAYWNKEDQEMF